MVALKWTDTNDLKIGDKIIVFDMVVGTIKSQDWGMFDGKLFLQSYGTHDDNSNVPVQLVSFPGQAQKLVWSNEK